MIKILHEVKFSNGKISVTNTFENIEVKVVKDEQIIETKILPLNICENKVVLDNIVSSLKSSHGLLFIEDDYVSVLSVTNKRYTIRGSGSVIDVHCSQEGSKFIKQFFLSYNYNELSFNDYYTMFGYN